MTMSTWHAPDDVLARYANEPEGLDGVTASSLEVHLLSCAHCRAGVAAASDPIALAALWDGVADRIDRPRKALVERLVRRLGVSEAMARLVAATASLQLAWLGALSAVVAGVVALAHTADADGPFLVMAPMVLLASVAAAFVPGADPAGEAGLAAPMAGLGVVLRRAVAVLIASLVVLAGGALALPGLELADAAWVLPALGLSLAALAFGTWVRVEVAAGLLATGWLVAVWTAVWLSDARLPAAELAPLAAPGQVVSVALILVAVPTLVARRQAFAALGGMK
jgi:hypothetical protein